MPVTEEKQLDALKSILKKMDVKKIADDIDLGDAKEKLEMALAEGREPDALTSAETDALKSLGYEIEDEDEEPKAKKPKKGADSDAEDEGDEDEEGDKPKKAASKDEDEDEDSDDSDDTEEDDESDEEDKKPAPKKPAPKKPAPKKPEKDAEEEDSDGEDSDDDDDEEDIKPVVTKKIKTAAPKAAVAKKPEKLAKKGGEDNGAQNKGVKEWFQKYFAENTEAPLHRLQARFAKKFGEDSENTLNGYLHRAKKGELIPGKVVVVEKILRVKRAPKEDEGEDEE